MKTKNMRTKIFALLPLLLVFFASPGLSFTSAVAIPANVEFSNGSIIQGGVPSLDLLPPHNTAAVSSSLFGGTFNEGSSVENTPPSQNGPGALIILESSDRASMQQAIDLVEGHGAYITTIYPPHILIGQVPENISQDMLGQAGIIGIYRSTVDLSLVQDYGEMAKTIVEVWNDKENGLPSLLSQADLPYIPENSAQMQPSNVQILGNGWVTVEYTPPYRNVWIIEGSALGGSADGWGSEQTGAVSGYVSGIIGGWAEAGAAQYIRFDAEGTGDAIVEVEMLYVDADSGFGMAGISGMNYKYMINSQWREEILELGISAFPWGLISPFLEALSLEMDALEVTNLFLQYNPASLSRSHTLHITEGQTYHLAFGLSVETVAILSITDAAMAGQVQKIKVTAPDTTGPPAPALLAPVDNTVQKELIFELDWGDVSDFSGVAEYHIEIDNDPGFDTPLYSLTSQNSQERIALPEGVYYWRVRAEDGAGNAGDWSDYRQVTVEVPHVSPEVSLPAVTIAEGNQHSPAVASGNSKSLVAWVDDNDMRVCAKIYDLDGNVVKQEFMVATSPQVKTPSVAFGDNKFFVTWSDARNYPYPELDWHIRGAIYDSTGNVVKTDFVVTEDCGQPAIAYGAERYIVVWSEGNEIRAATFDNQGEFIDNFTLYSDPTYALTIQDVSFTGRKFFVGWTGYAEEEIHISEPVDWDGFYVYNLWEGWRHSYLGVASSTPAGALVDNKFIDLWKTAWHETSRNGDGGHDPTYYLNWASGAAANNRVLIASSVQRVEGDGTVTEENVQIFIHDSDFNLIGSWEEGGISGPVKIIPDDNLFMTLLSTQGKAILNSGEDVWEEVNLDVRVTNPTGAAEEGKFFIVGENTNDIDAVGAPETPSLISPTNRGLVTSAKPSFDWHAPDLYGRDCLYTLVVDNDSNLSTPSLRRYELTSSEYSSDAPLVDRTYYWSIGALGSTRYELENLALKITVGLHPSYETWSEICQFTIDTQSQASRITAVNDVPDQSFWISTFPITIGAEAMDDVIDVQGIELWYRYSRDNVNWSEWKQPTWSTTSLESIYEEDEEGRKWLVEVIEVTDVHYYTDSEPPWGWQYPVLSRDEIYGGTWYADFHGEGYYEFYSVFIDSVGNRELSPSEADVLVVYEENIAPEPVIKYVSPTENEWVKPQPIVVAWNGGAPDFAFAVDSTPDSKYIPRRGEGATSGAGSEVLDYNTQMGIWIEVYDAVNGGPVDGAKVDIFGSNGDYISGHTDSNGWFEAWPDMGWLDDATPYDPQYPDYHIVMSKSGYSTETTTISAEVEWDREHVNGYAWFPTCISSWGVWAGMTPLEGVENAQYAIQQPVSPSYSGPLYFHLRSFDASGYGSATVHLGPFLFATPLELWETTSGTVSAAQPEYYGFDVNSPPISPTLDWESGDLDLHLYDPEGRHVGWNYATDELELEIPGAEYSGRDTKPEWIRVPEPQSGFWVVMIYPYEVEEATTYTLEISADTTPPESSVQPISPYWQESASFEVSTTASDPTPVADEVSSGVENVELWHRYSADSLMWCDWQLYGVDDDEPYSWSFTAGSDGFYEFYSVATDRAGNREEAPESADARAGVDTAPPEIEHSPLQWQGSGPYAVEATVIENVSGLAPGSPSLYYMTLDDPVFLDEFDGDSLDTIKWSAGSAGVKYDDITTSGEQLELTARAAKSGTYGAHYVVSNSPFDFSQGLVFEVPMSVPTDDAPADFRSEFYLAPTYTTTSNPHDSPDWLRASASVDREGVRWMVQRKRASAGVGLGTIYTSGPTTELSGTWRFVIDSENVAVWLDNELVEPDRSHGLPFTSAHLYLCERTKVAPVYTVRFDSIAVGELSWTRADMQPTGQPDEYSALIPDQPDDEAVWYYIHAEDVAANVGSNPVGAPANPHLFIVDKVPPTSSVDAIEPFWQGSTEFAVSATAFDAASGVESVELFYRYSHDNMTWSDWASLGVDSESPWAWQFDTPSGEGCYEFYSVAIDWAANREEAPEAADAGAGVDTTPPESEVNPIEPYWQNVDMVPFTVSVTASDAVSGVENVELWYRYSPDNSTWDSWTLRGTDIAYPWSWSFSPESDGYYEFYSVATDAAGNIEELTATQQPQVVFEEDFNDLADGVLAEQAGWTEASLRGSGGLSVSTELPYEGLKGVTALTHYRTTYRAYREINPVQGGKATVYMRASSGAIETFWLCEGKSPENGREVGYGCARIVVTLDGRDNLLRFGTTLTVPIASDTWYKVMVEWDAPATTARAWVNDEYQDEFTINSPILSHVDGIMLDVPDQTHGLKVYFDAISITSGAVETVVADAQCGVDTTPPESSVDPIEPYWQTSTPFAVTATVSDELNGVTDVELFHRHSLDNSTWCDWTSFGTDTEEPYSWSFDIPAGHGFYEFYSVATDVAGNAEEPPAEADARCATLIPATVDIDPDTLNLRSQGRWITAYIELPSGLDVAEIDVGTVAIEGDAILEGAVSAELQPTEVGDHDGDGVPDLMIKFDRSAVQGLVSVGDSVEITVIGRCGQVPFRGSDTIRVIDSGEGQGQDGSQGQGQSNHESNPAEASAGSGVSNHGNAQGPSTTPPGQGGQSPGQGNQGGQAPSQTTPSQGGQTSSQGSQGGNSSETPASGDAGNQGNGQGQGPSSTPLGQGNQSSNQCNQGQGNQGQGNSGGNQGGGQGNAGGNQGQGKAKGK